ncbi:hypothetical protein [Carboxylicivirga sp. RSCT41]|uniref:hypothetical protein n=1 Tax=Carboxylicivirga agarovorans TaxID=3417570 RepID=UPI003D356DB4
MSKPLIILKEYLIMPIVATEARIDDITKEIQKDKTDVGLNGLFLMLVSYIESMQKEIIKYYLKYHPEKLADNTIEVDKSVLKECEDFNMMEHIIADYVDKMPYWKLSKLFYSVLRIDKPNNQNEIDRIKKRRNELIHKNLEVNFKRNEIRQDFITVQYLTNSLEEFSIFLTDLKLSIADSFAYCTKINSLQNLWHYTFKTPLCSNFSDFWYIDEKNDSLAGCKHPEAEEGLSSGEQFMLSIWRSQVCGCKVDFLNMASIGRHYQNCLFMFLKLSDDIFLYS